MAEFMSRMRHDGIFTVEATFSFSYGWFNKNPVVVREHLHGYYAIKGNMDDILKTKLLDPFFKRCFGPYMHLSHF